MIKTIILVGISVIMLFSYAALIAGHNAGEQSERMYRELQEKQRIKINS